MIEVLISLDQELFLLLNAHHNDSFDFIMWWISNKYIWVPFYILIITVLIREQKTRSLSLIVSLLILIIVVDQATSSLMKPFFGRMRPCHDDTIGHLVHLVGSCGGKYSFVSGHAANSFAIATYVFLVLQSKKWKWIFAWAAVIAYSRVYLGVHYPADILIGGLFGFGAGYLVYSAYQKIFYKILRPL